MRPEDFQSAMRGLADWIGAFASPAIGEMVVACVFVIVWAVVLSLLTIPFVLFWGWMNTRTRPLPVDDIARMDRMIHDLATIRETIDAALAEPAAHTITVRSLTVFPSERARGPQIAPPDSY